MEASVFDVDTVSDSVAAAEWGFYFYFNTFTSPLLNDLKAPTTAVVSQMCIVCL